MRKVVLKALEGFHRNGFPVHGTFYLFISAQELSVARKRLANVRNRVARLQLLIPPLKSCARENSSARKLDRKWEKKEDRSNNIIPEEIPPRTPRINGVEEGNHSGTVKH